MEEILVNGRVHPSLLCPLCFLAHITKRLPWSIHPHSILSLALMLFSRHKINAGEKLNPSH